MLIFSSEDMFDSNYRIEVRIATDAGSVTGGFVGITDRRGGQEFSVALRPSDLTYLADRLAPYASKQPAADVIDDTPLAPPDPASIPYQQRPTLDFAEVYVGDHVILKSSNKLVNEHLEGGVYRVISKSSALSASIPAILIVEPLSGGKEFSAFLWRFVRAYPTDLEILTQETTS